eukprot:GILJ01005411.1.p1 GENE.GILJ01005411.1~~GILJ01005411.1.p1  ORF type:complete len:827 (+),score=173.77 GILJ01005411.1:243-2483(+)
MDVSIQRSMAEAQRTVEEQRVKIRSLEAELGKYTREGPRKRVRVEDDARDADQFELRSHVSHLEEQVSHLRQELEQLRIMKDKELKTKDMFLQQETKRVADLEQQRLFLLEEESATRKEIREKEDKWLKHKAETDSRLRALDKENHSLKQQLSDLQIDGRSTHSSLGNDLRVARDANKLLTAELETLRGELQRYKSTAESATRKAADDLCLRQQLLTAEETVRELKRELQMASENDRLVKHLRAEVSRYQDQDRRYQSSLSELKHLREQKHQAALLQEDISSLKSKIQRLELFEGRCYELEGQIKVLNHEKEEWKGAIVQLLHEGPNSAASGLTTPEDARQIVNRIHHEKLVLLEKTGELNIELSRIQAVANAKETKLKDTQSALQSERAKREELLEESGRQELRLAQLSRERDGLQSLLDSYSAQERRNASAVFSPAAEDPTRVDRMQFMELSLQQAKQQIAACQVELDSKNQLIQTLRTKLDSPSLPVPIESEDSSAAVRSLKASLEESQKECKRLTAQVEKLTNELILMEHKLGKGEYNRETMKVLHLKMNPHQQAIQVSKEQKEIDNLSIENSALKEKLAAVEKLVQRSAHLLPAASSSDKENAAAVGDVSALALENEQLKEMVANSKKRVDRLQHVFNKKSSEFREAIYRLLGWRIDMTGEPSNKDSQFVLRSMYAESNGDEIRFSLRSDRHFDLLETEFCRKLAETEHDSMAYLKVWNSIPAFLSHITLDLASKQTFVQS